jgi:hypothetical protein
MISLLGYFGVNHQGLALHDLREDTAVPLRRQSV